MFGIYKVSLPTFVKLAHFCVGLGASCFLVLWVGGLCGFIGKEILCKLLWMMFSSCRCNEDCGVSTSGLLALCFYGSA